MRFARLFSMKVRTIFWAVFCACAVSCRSPDAWRQEADRRADEHLRRIGALTTAEIARPSDLLRHVLMRDPPLPTETATPDGPSPLHGPVFELTLTDALRIGARNSREYQDAKESVFRAALELALREDQFRHSLSALTTGAYREVRTSEPTMRGLEGRGAIAAGQTLPSGASIAANLALDVAKLLTLDKDSAYGLLADATITLPLWRGAGRDVVLEPLRQAERNLLYALWDFQRFRRAFAVRIAGEYLEALQQQHAVRYAAANEERIALATRRAEQLARAGRLPEVQVDQARQDLLRARERTIAARLAAEGRMDRLKLTLGLPPDATIQLDASELDRLSTGLTPIGTAGDSDAPPAISSEVIDAWVREALAARLELRKAQGRAEDARRATRVAANALRAGLQLEVAGSAGEGRTLSNASAGNARLDASRGHYTARLRWEWPWRRSAERHAYRLSLLEMERADRAIEETEDRIKAEVRAAARDLEQARQSVVIQQKAVEVARRRIASVDLFLQAGRAQIRDLLEAQEALVSAQNALTAAVVAHRRAELALARDLERLEWDDEGLWRETRHDIQP